MDNPDEKMTFSLLRNVTKSCRGFNAEKYVEVKVKLINRFFETQELDSCVIGVSGGVDSATTFGLILRASKVANSPIKKILPVSLPIFGNGTTGQAEARDLALMQCKEFDLPCKVIDLTAAYNAIIEGGNSWADGQLASVLRTPALYYQAALLQTEGYKSVVVGTTNRDEGSYIGFFGKASDAMVDAQVIADIHKSEVWQVAKLVGVKDIIIQRRPTGDIWNGKTTEEFMGVPYWFLEMYLLVKEYSLQDMVVDLNYLELKLYKKWGLTIENWHEKNKFKYETGSQSWFIDAMPRKIKMGDKIHNGW